MNETKTKVGYVRVSSVGQKTDRQLDGIELHRVFEDKISGKSKDRPQLEEMIKYVREGDEVYVHSMDRLARNLNDLLSLIQELSNKGVSVHFVKENLTFDTSSSSSAMSKLMLSVMGAVAEFEREMILERQREGIALAKERGGAYKGRAKKVNPTLLDRARDLLYSGKNITEVTKELGVSRASLYRWFAEIGSRWLSSIRLSLKSELGM